MATDLSSVLLPDVPPVADSADNELLSIRAFLQQVAVSHNSLVRGTGTFTDEQKEVNKQVVEFANGFNALRQEFNMARTIVNAAWRTRTTR